MVDTGKKLGKLSLAILENFVEGVLGEKFVDALRQPMDREIAIATALGETESLFISKYDDKDLSQALFVDLKETDRPMLKEAVGKYFDHPTDPGLRNSLQQILFSEFNKFLSKERIEKAVDYYLRLLTKELMLADDVFRDTIAALAIVESNVLEQRQVELLEQIANKIVEQQVKPQPVLRPVFQLHQPPADFTGREELITQILKDFDSHKGATISGLTGMGGIGKSALGFVIAHQLANRFPDGQIFLDLKGTTTPLSSMEIARHVILSFEPTTDVRGLDENNFTAYYQQILKGKQALLFFDNARSADQIKPLIPPETCAMLVTSRWTFPVSGLKNHKIGVMEVTEAQSFLLELCPRINEHEGELAKVCGFLPLALRIAGSFLQVNEDWSFEKYLEKLNDRKTRLATFAKSRNDAELTTEPDLLATFELSYNQLNEDDQKRWRMLGVFPTSFDRQAADAMWELAEEKTTKQLSLLRRYSLLEYDDNTLRYTMHDLLTDYSLSQMEEGEEHDARLKHAAHYKDVLDVTDDLYIQGGEHTLLALKLFDAEWEHVQTAHNWIAESMGESQAIADLAIQYPDASAHCLDLRLAPQLKIQWLVLGADSAKELGRRDAEGVHLGNLGNAYYSLSKPHKALEYYEQSLNVAREIGDRYAESSALGNLGNAHYQMRNIQNAIEFYEKQLEIVREIGDRRGESNALGNLGVAHRYLGVPRKVIDFYEQQLTIVREIGDRRGEGNALGNLGVVFKDLGIERKAIEYYELALVIAQEIGDRRSEGTILGNLGAAYAGLGQAAEAIVFYEQALNIDRESDNRQNEGVMLNNLGSAHYSLGEVIKAIEFYEQALTITRETGDVRSEASATFNLGLALHEQHENGKAVNLVRQALKLFEVVESPDVEQARFMLELWGEDD